MAEQTHRDADFDIAVVGGGIAGLTTAIGLLKHNVKVTIYEAVHRFGEIGAGVAFGPNATKAMKLISPDVKAAFDRCSTSNQWPSKQHVWFDFRWGADVAGHQTLDKIEAVECPEGQATAHRADFLDEMVKLVPRDICRFNKRLTGVEYPDAHSVKLKFADGTEATHAALIGADGIKSIVRTEVLGPSHPNVRALFSGKYCHRGLVAMDDAIAVLGDELARNNTVYLGPNGHILTFPVRKGELMNIVAFSGKESWTSDKWVVPTSRTDMHRDFTEWGSAIHRLIDLIESPDIWAQFDHNHNIPTPTFASGLVCIIGDAAHASTSHQGSGAGMALEDAYVLSSLVAICQSPGDLPVAFKAFDSIRRPRTLRLIASSREAGDLWDLQLPTVMDDEALLKYNVEHRMQWIWNEDLEASVAIGRALMQQLAR